MYKLLTRDKKGLEEKYLSFLGFTNERFIGVVLCNDKAVLCRCHFGKGQLIRLEDNSIWSGGGTYDLTDIYNKKEYDIYIFETMAELLKWAQE